jgi:hypothetical protein
MQVVFPMPLFSLLATDKMVVVPTNKLPLICTLHEIHLWFQPYA